MKEGLMVGIAQHDQAANELEKTRVDMIQLEKDHKALQMAYQNTKKGIR